MTLRIMEKNVIATESEIEVKDIYEKLTARKLAFIFGGIAGIIVLSILACSVGAAHISFAEVAKVIFAKLTGLNFAVRKVADTVVWQVRFPRVLLAIVAGAGLAISGAGIQGITRNPLASPFTMGISAGAALGAAVAIVLGWSIVGMGKFFIAGNSFLFALFSAFLVLGVSKLRGTAEETLILAGIAIMYIITAIVSFLQFIAGKEKLQGLIHWLFGSLANANWDKLFFVSIFVFLGSFFLFRYSWDLNAMISGEEVAKGLGVNTERVKNVVLILCSFITAGVICFTGIIGFVCLMSPHIARMYIGADHRFLLPSSCIVGAFLLLGADTLGRTLLSSSEIPVGIIVAFLGGPFFLYLLLTKQRGF